MSCPEIVRQIPFYCYGELTSEIEESVESHLSGCAACRHEFETYRALLEKLDERRDVLDSSLLATCRADLRNALRTDASRGRRHSWLESLRNLSGLHIPFRIPVGAMALVAVGFFAARFTPERFGGTEAGVAGPMFSTVRSVQPDASGKVQIAVDDVRRHMVSGSVQDPRIQELLLAGLREESNPGVRVESVGILNSSADSEHVREALVYSLTHDPNSGVRLKALEGLKPYGSDVMVRRTLADVLRKDEDPAIRVQAIDLLTSHHDDSIVGALQDAVQKEDNTYVRTRCIRLLEDMKASVGTY